MEYDEELYDAARQKAAEVLSKNPQSLVAGEIDQLHHALSVLESMDGDAPAPPEADRDRVAVPDYTRVRSPEADAATKASLEAESPFTRMTAPWDDDRGADPEDAVNPHGLFSARTPASVGALGKLREQVEDLEHSVDAVRSAIWHNVFRRLAELEQQMQSHREEALEHLSNREMWTQLQGYMSTVDKLKGRVEKLEEQSIPRYTGPQTSDG